MMTSSLTGKVVLVTGASSGIGRSIASACDAQGARLVLTGRNIGALQAIAASFTSGNPPRIVPLDVTDRPGFARVAAEVEAAWGGIDVLVASAGEYHRGNAAGLAEETIRRSMEVNFFGALNAVYAVLPGMLKRKSGHLVVISSVDGKKALPLDAPYAASKFALTGFMDALRQDLHGTGVAVSTVLPGRVDTPMIANLSVPWISKKISPEAVARTVLKTLRTRKPETTVPALSSRALILTAAVSPGVADWLIRLFRLEGDRMTTGTHHGTMP